MECSRCHVVKTTAEFRTTGRVCRACQYEQQRAWVAANHDYNRALKNAWRRDAQRKAYDAAVLALGGCCAHCGNADRRVLDIDHINGGGTQDRQRRDRIQVLKGIIVDQSGFQLLCCNCHRIKTLGGTRSAVD